MKRLYSQQRFYTILVLVAIFGLVGERSYEWQKGFFLDDVLTLESFEALPAAQFAGPDAYRAVASEMPQDLAPPNAPPLSEVLSEPGTTQSTSDQTALPPSSLVDASAPPPVAANAPPPPVAAPPLAARRAQVQRAEPPVADPVVIGDADKKFHTWSQAFETKSKKQLPKSKELASEINRLLNIANATSQPLAKSESLRLVASMEILLAREANPVKKAFLRRRAFHHLQESVKAFPGNFLSQWLMGLAVLKIEHKGSLERSASELVLGIRADEELNNSIQGVSLFKENLSARFLLETLLEVKDSKKQLSKEDAQFLSTVKQDVKNFRAQPAKSSEVKTADAALEKVRPK